MSCKATPEQKLGVKQEPHYLEPSSPIQALRVNIFWWKVIYRMTFCSKLVTPWCIITNQPISAQLSHAHSHVLWQKACGEIYRSNQKAKACSKNNSPLERVDSRVQHIWRPLVMGAWCQNKTTTCIVSWVRKKKWPVFNVWCSYFYRKCPWHVFYEIVTMP